MVVVCRSVSSFQCFICTFNMPINCSSQSFACLRFQTLSFTKIPNLSVLKIKTEFFITSTPLFVVLFKFVKHLLLFEIYASVLPCMAAVFKGNSMRWHIKDKMIILNTLPKIKITSNLLLSRQSQFYAAIKFIVNRVYSGIFFHKNKPFTKF